VTVAHDLRRSRLARQKEPGIVRQGQKEEIAAQLLASGKFRKRRYHQEKFRGSRKGEPGLFHLTVRSPRREPQLANDQVGGGENGGRETRVVQLRKNGAHSTFFARGMGRGT